MKNFDLKKYLAEGKLLKEDESLDSKLDNLEDVYDPEPQISTAVFNEEGFYLTPSDIDAIKDTAQVEYSEYQNQEKMIGPEADSIIKKFKKEVTPEIWKDWVEYNEGDDRIAHILNLFNEIYAEGEILKEESINEAWINNWFDLLLNGVLIVSALQYSLNKAGLSLKDPKGIINKVDPKSIIKKVKDGWKYMTNKKVYDIVKKLINDPDILQAAKVELRGPRGGKRKLDNQIAYQQVLKSKLSEEELNILKAFSEDLIKKDFTKDLKARTYRDNGSYPYRKPLKNTYDFKKYKDDTEGEESINEGLNDRVAKVVIGYTDSGRLYKVVVSDADGKRLGKLHQDDTNDLLKMFNIKDEIPLRISQGDDEVLDSIVKQLQDQGIEASWDDFMDVS